MYNEDTRSFQQREVYKMLLKGSRRGSTTSISCGKEFGKTSGNTKNSAWLEYLASKDT